MPRVQNRNLWGAAGQGIDSQRTDLFKVLINLPPALGGTSTWQDHIEFAIEKFPFPERDIEMIPLKFLQQTNFQLGSDVAPGPIDIPVRYAFNQPTMQILEQWNFLTHNPKTGGVGMTSMVKANGVFIWRVPNMAVQNLLDAATPSDDTLIDGAHFILEGCLVKGLKYSDGDMTANNGLVTATLKLQVDRWYPDPSFPMTVTGAPGGFTGGSLGT